MKIMEGLIQNGNSKKRTFTVKESIRSEYYSPVTAAEIQAISQLLFSNGAQVPKYQQKMQIIIFEQEIQGVSKTSSSAQNVAFVSQSKSSTNKVKSGFTGAYSTCTPSTSSTNVPEKEVLAGFADEVIYSLFAKQSEDWDLLHEDLEQIDDVDIEEMDINWQIAMIAIRMKKFYKKTGRRVRVDGKTPVGFDKKKLECFNCHNTGHFARECTAKGTHDGKKKRDSLYQHQEAGKQEKNQMGLLTMDDGIVNWGEHTEAEETNHALMAISSSNEVTSRSINYLPIQAVKKLEAPLVNFQKQQFSLNVKATVSDDRSSEFSTCQSNDSAGSIGTSSEHSVDLESEISRVPSEVYVSTPITTNKTSVSAPKSKEVEPSCVSNIKTPRQPIKEQATPKVNRKNWNAMMERELGEGYSFTKKKCFVCGSLSHLIKDCDYYEKKKAREAEVKRVVNTGNGMAKPVWTNANRVNHSNKFVPRSVQLNAGRPNINSVRPNINTGRTNINSVRPRVNAVSSNVNTVRSRQPVPTKTSNSFSPKRPQMNQINQRRDFSKSHSSVRRPFAKTTAQMSHSNAVKGNWGSAVKTSASYNWRNSRPNFNYNSGPTFIRTVNAKGPQGRPKPAKAWWCSGHMTCNKDHWRILKIQWGSDTFGELGHFNLFSISQICDKQHKVLFTETECLVVSSDFKMPDENQILLKVPRHHNMYSFDMKTPTPAKDNGTEFKNRDMLEFCGNKGIKQEYSNARTPQQNGVAERMNRTLIEAARTMLADSLLPTTFWAEAVSTACYIFNRFDGKSDEGFLVGYSLNSKAYRVYNLVTKRVEVNLHVNFLEDKPNVKGVGYRWMFDIDYLTDSMNYIPVSLENQANPHAGTSEKTNNAGTSQTPKSNASEEKDEDVELIVVPSAVMIPGEIADSRDIFHKKEELEQIALKHLGTVPENNSTSTPSVNTGSQTVNTGRLDDDDSPMPELEIFHKSETGIFDEASYDEEGVITDFNSLPIEIEEEPKKIVEALQDDSWVQAMQEELLQFKLQQVWVLVDLLMIGGPGYTHGRMVLTMMRFLLLWLDIEAIVWKGLDERQISDEFNGCELIFFFRSTSQTEQGGIFISQDKPDIMYASSVCSRFSAFSDSDYGGSNLDRKSTTGGCQFLVDKDFIHGNVRNRQAVVTSTTEAEYVAAANCCGQHTLPLWKNPEYIIQDKAHRDTSPLYKRYALTSNPTIYDSLVQQFWQTATPNTIADGTLEINATIDTIRYLVHHLLQCIALKVVDGIHFGSNIATALDLLSTCLKNMHAVTQTQPSSSTPPVPSISSPPVQSPPPIPTPTPTPIPETEPAPFEHTFEEPSPLISRIDSLETDLKQTKLTMGNAIVKLVKKVKKLEGFLKRRNMVLSDSEEEEPEAQGRKSQDDPLASLVQGLPKLCPGLRLVFQEEVNTAEGVNTGSIKLSTVSEQVSTGSAKRSTPSPDKGQRAGKAPMIIEETPKKSKEQILQEEASLAEAIRLDTLQKEEVAKQVHLDSLLAQRIAEEEELNEQQKKRKAQVQFEAQHYTDEDWDLIRAKIEANAELIRGHGSYSQLKNLSFDEVKEEFDKQASKKELESVEAKDDEPTRNEVGEQDDSVSGTKIPINHVPVAMKSPSIATYKIIKQGEKGVYQIVREMN
ncbi:ribonuclease H-like domain-containing protein [Tanacetum coccineum]